MKGRLTLLFVAAAIAAACSSDTADPPTTPSPGTSRLAIAPQPDFLTVGTSLTLEARLTEGTSPPRVVAAEWSSSDGRVVAVERTGRVTAAGSGSATLRAVFGNDSTTLAIRVAPDFAGTWTGARRVTACIHPRPDVCAAAYPPNRIAQTTLVLTQARDRVTGTLTFSPPLASPSSAVTGTIDSTGRLALDGAIISTPATGATTTLGALADWRTEIEPSTGILRGSFVESRTDADGTTWRVSWELQGLTRTR
jgi:Big-like domain-containing protein